MTSEPGRVLALDLGEARIGLALSDPLGITAQPLETVERVSSRRDIRRIADCVREHAASTVVVGLPRLLSGDEGPAARAAREFAARLARRLGDVSVEMWDERLTTALAERTMISGRARRSRRRQRVDQLAAVLILQSYLDARAETRE